MAIATTSVEPVQFLGILADDLRWQILTALARSDYRVQELVERFGKPMNLVSYHLGKLRRVRLVSERRSDADSREVYYSLDLARLQELYVQAGESLHPALGTRVALGEEVSDPKGRTPRILFLCTENSARSQMAEGVLRNFSHGRVEVASAGSRPTRVHPTAVEVLAEQGIDISHHRSKSLEEFRDQRFDYTITVCDRVKETCPSFPGDPQRIHWSFADPAAVSGPADRVRDGFRRTANELQTMIRYLLILIERDSRRAA